MKPNLSLARVCGLLAAVALFSAACVPVPESPLPAGRSTASVFLPALEAPGLATSPLQPEAALTSSLPVSATVTPGPAVVLAGPAGARTATPQSAPAVAPPARPMPALAGPVWEWVSSALKDSPSLAPADPGRYTFQLLGDGNALIQADCNFGTGSYTESANRFSFTAIGTTKMACPPDSLDSAFLGQLRYIASYRFENSDLVITLQDGAGSMRLRQAGGEAVTGPAATDLATAPARTGAPGPAAPLPTPALPPPPTPTPAPPATPRSTFLGTPVPIPTPVADATVLPALSGTSWLLVSLTANGKAVPPIGATPTTVEIDQDGRGISGTTGCNQFRASLSADAMGAVVLGPALTTQKTCAADLMVQEVEFIDGLLRARSYVVRGNELTLVDVAGNSLMVLVRR